MTTSKRILVVLLTLVLWVMLGGGQTWCVDKSSPEKYLEILEKEFGTREPVAEVSKIVSLSELPPDAPTEPAWGPVEPMAPGCTWYWYYLPNWRLVNLQIDHLKLRDPAFGQGPFNFFPPGGVNIPATSALMGIRFVGWCARHLEVQYKLAGLPTKTNQAFWGNVWCRGGWYGFRWNWKHINKVVPGRPILFIKTPWEPDLQASDFCDSALYPITPNPADTICTSWPDSVFYDVGDYPETSVPFLTQWGLIALLLVLLVIASWVFFRRRRAVRSKLA